MPHVIQVALFLKKQIFTDWSRHGAYDTGMRYRYAIQVCDTGISILYVSKIM
jgi:hypothetical protein